MKLKLLIFTALIICGFLNISAQERRLSADEFAAIQKKSSVKGKSYRRKLSEKVYKKPDGALQRFFYDTWEYMASGDIHTVTEWGTPENTNRAESYVIGQTMYNLNTNGTWRQSPLKIATQSNADSRPKPQTETTAEHFYKGKVLYNNQLTDYYESRFTTKTTENGRESITTFISKSWYKLDGMILRTEATIDYEKFTAQRIFEWEYDPNIKFEAPVK